ncbi:MAG: hypothetical protein ACI35S_02850 [Anaeroplasma sp.]
MKKYSKIIEDENDKFDSKANEEAEEEQKLDVNSIEVVVDRVEHGLIGSLRINNDMNKPIFKREDIIHLRAPSRLQIKDFVLYKSHDEYFLRRIIKYKDDSIYVAGDNEKEYHIIKKEEIVGKVIGRERKGKFYSLSLKNKNSLYSFSKVNMAYFRLKDRILDYEGEINNEALEIAMHNLQEEKTETKPVEYKYDIDLDSELADFLNPDVLVDQLEAARAEEAYNSQDVEESEYSDDEEYDEEDAEEYEEDDQ